MPPGAPWCPLVPPGAPRWWVVVPLAVRRVSPSWHRLAPSRAMNRVKEVERINRKDVELQLRSDTVGNAGKWDVSKSWHAQYKDSAYVYVGGLPYDLSEGDIIVIFSQCGEIVDVNMPRDKDTGKPKGFAFIAYEDQRSTVLAVDNFNGAKVLGRTLRCDHCQSFREEQKKDADNLPDHLLKKLGDKELEQKKQEIERRNGELEEAAAAKDELFAHGRGTAEEEAEAEERRIRLGIIHQKEAEATAKRTSHIEAVLAKRKAEHDRATTEEQRKEQRYQERKKQRQLEAGLAKQPDPPALPPPQLAAPAATMADDELVPPVAVESKWERLMNGGGKKKKRPKLFKGDGDADGGGDGGGDGPPGPGAGAASGNKDGISVSETNRLRESLGLKPLRE